MDRDPLLARLRRVPGLAGRPELADFDPGDDGQVDVIAGELLTHFRATADTEAFTLLYELTRERLSNIAQGVARRLHRNLSINSKKKPRRYTLWISDDEKRLPLLITAKTEYGLVKVELVSWQK